ncbi:MAG TPA: N-acetylmuramoyl-L-alanine amidase [Methylomusa anaerophila]|uniref:N-acetylmuramoyl-L-alanine amidase AmiC n=1 Tax=Methylomusa anaerophila TaxID=1930071 RepID=A0A348AMJ8_9FIRM|nr:N-acetylmuramoyl-L-alanine amidase [Methylomusa anaerophila]BBB92296.1 N-acetylmuramoyl-L-alanine amidase AmiC precursor [Methylomusa anaerophila]HML90243.1 N-acetylmuramoyl-L-alanine amidase [Methylomusa anaerophila]
MQRLIVWVLLAMWLMMPGVLAAEAKASGASQATKAPEVKAVTLASALKPNAAGSSSETSKNIEITNIRWANHTDSIAGTDMVRVVMDSSGPVEADGTIISAPTPRLVVNIKGAKPGTINNNIAFDGKIVDKVSVTANANDNITKIVFDLSTTIEDNGYKVFTLPSNDQANKSFRVVVDINKPLPIPNFSFTAGLKDKVIVLDPGHGGSDPGAIGPSKTQEKMVTLAVANNVKNLLEKAGAVVVMTRQNDRDVYGPNASAVNELKARTTVANNRKADVFLSIHADSFTDRSAGGTSTYYYSKTLYDAMLARSLQASLIEAGQLQDRRANPANFYVVKNTRMPAALVELGFISNPQEEKLLNSPDFQQKISSGIVNGLERFFSQAARLRGGE